MSTKTRYILQGLFFILLGAFCIYQYFFAENISMKKFTGPGIIFSMFIGVLFIKNAFKR